MPAYRAIGVTVDGTPIATVQPFEYVNTGGLDLYLWDPVTGAYTTNDVPYEVDVTAALGLIEGSHAFNATVIGRESGSGWFVGGSLLLYTNSSISGASLVSDPNSTVYYSNGTSGSSGVPPPEYVTDSYSYASNLDSSNGVQLVQSWTNESFSSKFPVGPNANESGAVVSATTQFQEAAQAPWGTYWSNSTSSPSIAFASGSVFIVSSKTNGGYPIYGNVTQTMYWFNQNWNMTSTRTVIPTHGPRSLSVTDSNDNVTANGMYSGAEKEISQAAAELLSINTFWSNTTKSYASSEVSGPLAAYYSHRIVSELTPADLSTNLASVLFNTVQYTDSASLNESKVATDAGQANTLAVRTLGFGAPFTFTWTGLPSGCIPTATQLKVVCTAAVPKAYSVSVVALGAFGQAAPEVTVSWTVYPDPAASVSVRPAIVDVGRSTQSDPRPFGGTCPVQVRVDREQRPGRPRRALPEVVHARPGFSRGGQRDRQRDRLPGGHGEQLDAPHRRADADRDPGVRQSVRRRRAHDLRRGLAPLHDQHRRRRRSVPLPLVHRRWFARGAQFRIELHLPAGDRPAM